MNFRVGQKGVCVDASPTYVGHPVPLTLGAIYTIETVVFACGLQGVSLREVKSFADRHHRAEFLASRFRPLVERKTDTGMAILKSILDEVNAGKVREIADA